MRIATAKRTRADLPRRATRDIRLPHVGVGCEYGRILLRRANFHPRRLLRKSPIKTGLLAAAFSLLGVRMGVAGTCLDLPPVPGPMGYHERSGPDRCEGLYESPVAGQSLEILSFVRHPIVFDRHSQKILTVIAPGAEALGSKEIAIVARALPLRVYYRMDAQIPAGGSLAWPIGDVVIPAGLSGGDLGIVGLSEGSKGRILVPLDVAAVRTMSPGTDYQLTLRAPTDLETFQWRLYDAGWVAAWRKTVGQQLRAGDPIRITLDKMPGEVLTLDIAAKPAGGEYIRTRLQIFLP
jgi:hypothetical protein